MDNCVCSRGDRAITPFCGRCGGRKKNFDSGKVSLIDERRYEFMKSVLIAVCEESRVNEDTNICGTLWHHVLWLHGLSFCLECGKNLYS